MELNQVISDIKRVARATLPPNSKLLLYGSRARGDARPDSDWDLLILIDKPKITADDYDVTYPFRELGWSINEEINPQIYSETQWRRWTFLPFYKNVERDKILLYES